MPASVGVVDAFKNLIRHGKHHHHNNQQQQQQQQHTRHIPDVPQDIQHEPVTQNHQHHQHEQVEPVSPPAREAAEIIVKEERENKSKMPTYPGLENFSLMEKMGDGAFSNVYKALDRTSDRKVALKIVRKYELNASQDGDKHLNPQFKKKPRVTERANILKEVQIMRGTHHPSIVKLLAFAESKEYYYLTLELMEGGELFHQIVKLTYFSENLSRHVILQVAEGLRYLHQERGVVHRDIKPENLLFERIPIIPSKNPIHRPYDEDKEDEGEFIPGVGGGGIGRVKIADFGLSKVVWDEQTMTPCGTVGYTAPEIVKDERYSRSVDMWALGCVLYTLLCGFPPFYDESINVLTEKVARGYYTFLSPWWDDISHSSKDLISNLLCVNPSQRYSIDQFLAHSWCHAAPAPPPPPTPFIYNQPIVNRPLESPLLASARGGRGEGRSPGLAILKEAFDVTYAVHRMEEEGARRKGAKSRGAGGRGLLQELNEDEEIDVTDTNSLNRDKHYGSGQAGVRDQGNRRQAGQRKGGPTFELDMDGATLLERRHKRRAALGASSPLAGNVQNGYIIPPGSPMRVG